MGKASDKFYPVNSANWDLRRLKPASALSRTGAGVERAPAFGRVDLCEKAGKCVVLPRRKPTLQCIGQH